MEKRKYGVIASGCLFVLSIVYTVLVSVVDKAPIGPNETSVGFSAMNKAFADAIGLNLTWDKITDLFMGIALLVALSFVVIGFIQLIQRKSLLKVDKAILVLAGVYVLVVILYVVFDKFALNYRPYLLPDETELEASFPSSHVLVICTILSTAISAWSVIFYEKKVLFNVLRFCAIIVMLLAVAGRALAGVHWITDIIAGVIYSATIACIYMTILVKIYNK
jgi:undecaprenyl-diphosphatase